MESMTKKELKDLNSPVKPGDITKDGEYKIIDIVGYSGSYFNCFVEILNGKNAGMTRDILIDNQGN